jgi:hypothetical protein
MVTVKNPHGTCLDFISPFFQPDPVLERACSEVPPSPKIPRIHWILYKKVPCHAFFPENGYSQNHRKIPNSVSISGHQNQMNKKAGYRDLYFILSSFQRAPSFVFYLVFHPPEDHIEIAVLQLHRAPKQISAFTKRCVHVQKI